MDRQDPAPAREPSALTSTPVVIAALTAITLAAFWGVWLGGFVYDDMHYVVENPHVQQGLTARTVAWAFTSFHASNWHPLTWLSHAVDHSIFGLDPAGHHGVNLLLHIVNVALLFVVLVEMTGARGRSAVVACFFAIHPLHVESVAWVAERKDVLSTLFLFLTLLAYTRYARRPAVGRYVVVTILFALGLMSKPMLVTLPCLLLLLDAWPLGRLDRRNWRTRVAEKIPLLVLSALSSAVTLAAQRPRALAPLSADFSVSVRIANALVSYATYLAETVWPSGLSVLVPHPGAGIAPWKVIVALAVLSGITWGAVRLRRTAPYLLVGWLWYVGTLVPVIGLVQVGQQAMADRYTYVPLLGVFIAIAWGVEGLVRGRPATRRAVQAATVGIVVVLSVTTHAQVRHWRDARALFLHALDLNPDNAVAHTTLGVLAMNEGRPDEALRHLSEAVRIEPAYPEAHFNLGVLYSKLGRRAEAITAYRTAIELRPDSPRAHTNLGALMVGAGFVREGIAQFRTALELRPTPQAYVNLGIALEHDGKTDEAVELYRRALEIDPEHELARARLGASR
jgi:tetratricopeptide (TPR) repeat protein